ncbi:MAG: trigger factor [Ardenticatenaceae bacterium]|nr:trigger factor [Ardenticatenaceae bacterium]MCB9443578.1 trigger factor [Ardenticatenaceae bacterium]
MTLTIHTEENEQRELKVTIEVPEERVEQEMRQAARKLSKEINIPGFRRGKVPYNVILRRVGRDALRAEAIDDMVQGVFEEAMEEVDPEMYGRPTFDDMETEPLVFKFTVPLSPQIDLAGYRELRKEIEPVNITDEAVEEALEQVQTRHQKVEPVDRPAAVGDLVTISGKGELVQVVDDVAADSEEAEDGAEEDDYKDIIFNEESVDFLLDAQKLYLGEAFIENIVGMSAGDEKSFIVTFPEYYKEEELAGKEADFEITLLNVKERELPPLDDELAKLEGDFETLDELKASLRKSLERQAVSDAKNELIEDTITDMLTDAHMVYPPAAVEMEIDDMVASFKEQVTRSGWQWEDFIRLQNNSEDEIRNNFRKGAVERLERQQILRQFVLNEKLTVSAEDVDIAIENRLESFGGNDEFKESMRSYFNSGYGFDMISSEVIMDKVHDRMVAILSGEAPDLDAIAEAEEAADEEE